MNKIISSAGNRQHLKLSDFAWSVIDNDCVKFASSDIPIQTSSFINRIVSSYINTGLFPANIDALIIDNESNFRSILSADKSISKKSRDILTDKFLEEYKRELSERLIIPKKGSGRKVHLNKEVTLATQIPEGSTLEAFFGKTGRYLTCILENYASKPFVERELIYFNEIIEIINNAIKLNYSITVETLYNKKYIVVPYRICTNRLSSYNYLAGISAPFDASDENAYQQASFRLSRIANVIINTKKVVPTPPKLTKELIKKLDSSIDKNGVEFLLNPCVEAKIRLTDEGIKMYNSRHHMKPQLIERNNDIFSFYATSIQIKYFFFSFGKDAEILEPEHLRNMFKEEYEKALNCYNS